MTGLTRSGRPAVPVGSGSAEAELLLSLARPDLPDDDGAAHRALLGDIHDLDWAFLLDQSVRHRVAAIVARNFELHDLPYPSAAIREAFRANLLFTRARNAALGAETRECLRALDRAGVRTLVRKGQYLSRRLYPEAGIRPMADLDLLVRRDDLATIDAVLAELGYVQGRVSPNLRVVRPLDRREALFWQLNTASQAPYIRLTGDPFVQAYVVDLRCGILEPASDRTLDVSDWFQRAEHVAAPGADMYAPCRDDFMIDVCVHLHREATTLVAIEGRKDLQLLRFVDMLMLLGGSDLGSARFVNRVRHCGVDREVAYAFALLTRLYRHDAAEAVSALLPAVSDDYLDEYGVLDGAAARWSSDFRSRLFDNYRFREPAVRATLRP